MNDLAKFKASDCNNAPSRQSLPRLDKTPISWLLAALQQTHSRKKNSRCWVRRSWQFAFCVSFFSCSAAITDVCMTKLLKKSAIHRTSAATTTSFLVRRAGGLMPENHLKICVAVRHFSIDLARLRYGSSLRWWCCLESRASLFCHLT